MKTIILLVLISSACFAQKKQDVLAKNTAGTEQVKPVTENLDSVVMMPDWHKQQIAFEDTEIKRLQATTIEAEIQRHAQRKEDLLTAFFLGKVNPDRIEPGSIKIESNLIRFKFKPKK